MGREKSKGGQLVNGPCRSFEQLRSGVRLRSINRHFGLVCHLFISLISRRARAHARASRPCSFILILPLHHSFTPPYSLSRSFTSARGKCNVYHKAFPKSVCFRVNGSKDGERGIGRRSETGGKARNCGNLER
jgi:hypothetical protein